MMSEVSMSPTRPSKPARKRRSFTPDFKAEAVRLVRTSGKSIGAVARELDLTETRCARGSSRPASTSDVTRKDPDQRRAGRVGALAA
jgi:transposase-like protein